MAAAYIEPRPHGASTPDEHRYYVIMVDGSQVNGKYDTQREAKESACRSGYRPVHVARVRHFPNRDIPDHWRVDPC